MLLLDDDFLNFFFYLKPISFSELVPERNSKHSKMQFCKTKDQKGEICRKLPTFIQLLQTPLGIITLGYYS